MGAAASAQVDNGADGGYMDVLPDGTEIARPPAVNLMVQLEAMQAAGEAVVNAHAESGARECTRSDSKVRYSHTRNRQ